MESLPGPRRRTLDALRGSPAPLTLAQLAASTGAPPNTVRDHLVALAAAGLVTDVPPVVRGRGRPARRFAATPATDEATGVLAALAAEVGERPDALAAALSAGRRWADGLPRCPGEDPLDCAVRLLRQLGFEPEAAGEPGGAGAGRGGGGGVLVLRACPVRPAADSAPGVICAMHLGLLQAVLPDVDVSLQRRSPGEGCLLGVAAR